MARATRARLDPPNIDACTGLAGALGPLVSCGVPADVPATTVGPGVGADTVIDTGIAGGCAIGGDAGLGTVCGCEGGNAGRVMPFFPPPTLGGGVGGVIVVIGVGAVVAA